MATGQAPPRIFVRKFAPAARASGRPTPAPPCAPRQRAYPAPHGPRVPRRRHSNCPAADAYIDPWRPVDRALITHGPCRSRPPRPPPLPRDRGRGAGDAPPPGPHSRSRTTRYGEIHRIGAATISFHPAGHVPGSAQIRVEVAGEVLVVSGDYKTTPDGLSEPFEPVRCHAFITEIDLRPADLHMARRGHPRSPDHGWWAETRDKGQTPILGVYALG